MLSVSQKYGAGFPRFHRGDKLEGPHYQAPETFFDFPLITSLHPVRLEYCREPFLANAI
jgi:hypothetical protein